MDSYKETQDYRGYTIEIIADDSPEDPRSSGWDNFGVMAYRHGNYRLGDEIIPTYYFDEQGNEQYIDSWKEVETYLRKEKGAYILLPLYLYDHSGITMKTSPFGDQWDSGQVGYIYATERAIRTEYSVKRITKQTLEKAKNLLEAEVQTYDQYISGDVWGYNIIDPHGNTIDSCYGFYGQAYAIEEAKNMVDYKVKEQEQAREAKTKKYIKGNVPLIYRA